MGKTSSAAKYKYNSKSYKQFNVQIKPALFDAIVKYCDENALSRSQFLQLSLEALQSSKKING